MTNYLSHKITKLSFISIIMVVFLHAYNLDTKQGGVVLHFEKGCNWWIQQYISNGITRIAVPLFFLISGFLFFKGNGARINFSDKIKKRISTLVVPYFIWTLFGILFYWLLQSFPQSQSFFTKKLIVNYSFNDWINAIFVTPIPYQFWFIRDLIVITILSPIVYWILKKAPTLFFLLLIPFWFLNQDTIFLTSESVLFFSVGGYISIHKPELSLSKSLASKAYLLTLLWLLIVAVKTCVVFSNGSHIVSDSLHKLSILIGILGMWTLYDKLSNKTETPINTLFHYSFFIFAFHEPFLTIAKKGLFFATQKTQTDYLLIYFAAPLIIIAFSILVAAVLKKYMQSLYLVLTGNR